MSNIVPLLSPVLLLIFHYLNQDELNIYNPNTYINNVNFDADVRKKNTQEHISWANYGEAIKKWIDQKIDRDVIKWVEQCPYKEIRSKN